MCFTYQAATDSYYFEINSRVSLAISSSSFVGTTQTSILNQSRNFVSFPCIELLSSLSLYTEILKISTAVFADFACIFTNIRKQYCVNTIHNGCICLYIFCLIAEYFTCKLSMRIPLAASVISLLSLKYLKYQGNLTAC